MGLDKSTSPVRTIASPKIMRGLSITKQQKKERNDDDTSRVSSPDIRIRNHRLGSGSGFGRPSIQNEAMPDFEKMSLDERVKSPHKLNKGDKLRRYKEA